MNEFLLDDTALRFIAARIERIRVLESEMQGALSLLIEQNGLTGKWQLDPDNRRLIRMTEPQQMKAA
jgi:hypothetical protein